MAKKILHLICNSHLDPVWQWDWDEGASSALSTFYAACELLDKYDFIFCHNEVLLYEYIEKYDAELFKRIQKLVELGKWKIMGGWYIQPDCLVPSGESFIRQISLGREYFLEKFNSRPTTAINFDAFGHTKGISDVLSNCGYDSYVFCRPMSWHLSVNEIDCPHGPFLWKGYSNGLVKAIRIEDENIYSSGFGLAKNQIVRKANHYDDLDRIPILWGVGNHGGLSSEKDYEDIMLLQDEKKGEWEIIHSSLEDYFKEVYPNKIFDRQMICFIKSYSSVHAIKLAHDQLENALYLTEKICSVASLQSDYKYNKDLFKQAEKTLCQIEFHDVLSGTAIKTGIFSSIRKAHRAIENLKEEFFLAFTCLAKQLKKVIPGDDNIVLFNPYPYTYEGYVESEFFLLNGLFSNEESYSYRLYDKDNNDISYQIIKEESNINLERRVRLLYKVKIPPFSVISYGINKFKVNKISRDFDNSEDIVIKDNCKSIVINRKTGLVDSFIVNGIERVYKNSFLPMMFEDNEDPWGWWLKTLENNLRPFKLDTSSKYIYKGLKGVCIVENGELLTQVESTYKLDSSFVIVDYKIYKNVPYFDVNFHVIWNERNKGLKIKIPLKGKKSYFAQMAFGMEEYKNNGYEYPSNRYVGNSFKDGVLSIYNNSGIHSVSKSKNNLYLTLLNGSAYCAHPMGDPKDKIPLLPDQHRFEPFIEQGVSDFSIRVMFNQIDECEKYANEFNQKVYSVQYFPHGDGNLNKNLINLSNSNIVITAFKKLKDDSYLIRLYNGSKKKQNCTLTIKNSNKSIVFSRYKFISLIFKNDKILIKKDSSIY